MTTYVSNDLAFDLPAPRAAIEDRTIHELVVPGEEGPCELMLAISRKRLAGALADAVSQLHDEERRSLGAFELTIAGVRRGSVLDWIDTRLTWKHPSGPVYHRRLHCQLGSLWMSITVTTNLGNAAAADEVAEHVVRTFRPRPEENA